MKKAAGILLKFLAVIVVLLLLVALLCGIFLACTPAQLGMDKIAVTPRYTVGGLGLAPSANIGRDAAIFEAV